MTTPRTPADQAARDTAIGALAQTIFVEASAGTGKTTLLVERVVGLITSGTARMEQIAAITFTEAAAAELLDRLSRRFDELATPAPDDPAAAAACALESAAVSTVHGFARRLLAEHPFEVGLPPAFEVGDAGAHRIEFDQRWDAFVAHLLRAREHADLVGLALSCGVTWDRCQALAWACEEQWERLTAGPAVGCPPDVDTTELVDALERALTQTRHCIDPDDALLRFLEQQTARHLDAVRDAAGPLDAVQVLAALPRLTAGRKGRAPNWPDGSKEVVHQLLARAEGEHTRLLAATTQWILASLTSLIVDFTLEGAADRRRRGLLSFHDLLVLACELVREHPEARRHLHDRFTHLLIDEFQDTDPLQVELAFLLAADPAQHESETDWQHLAVEPGRLFLVGDPKQSIYRFRRADIDVFTRARGRLGGERVQLTSNFRSRPVVIDWVNEMFADLFGTGVPGCQPSYEPLVAFEDQGCGNPRGLRPVVLLGTEVIAGPMEQVRSAQVADVAAALATLHAEQWPIGPDAHAFRFADVAVLVRNRTNLSMLEEAFEAAGVPYRLESSTLVYESDEVRQLVSLLRAIDDPTDAVSVLAALRSPAFGCGDDELLAHARRGGRWDPRRPGSGTAVAVALADLGARHAQRWWKGVSALVTEVVEEYGLLAQALVDSRPRESWRRLQFLLDQARRFEEADGGDLRSFLRWIDCQHQDGAQAVEMVLPESDDDAVRITTMHAAKGLEFPVVVLLGLESRPRSELPPLLFDRGAPEVCLGRNFRTPGYDDVLEFERAMESYEQRRLLYVAATRARDLLMVSVHRTESSVGSLADDVAALCQRAPDNWSDGSVLCVPRCAPAGVATTLIEPHLHEPLAREQWAKERSVVLDAARQPRSVAATAVRRLHQGARELDDDQDGRLGATGGTGRGRAGTAIGRAVHSVLEVIDLRSAEGLDDLCRTHAAFEGVAGRAGDVRALVRSALASDVVRTAIDAPAYWREVYVGVPMGDRILEGFVDLLIDTAEGLLVVDYKTDRLEDPDDGQLGERYRLQAASYAVAVEAALGRPVAGCALLALAPEGARTVTIVDLEAAKTEVRDLFGQVAA